MKSAPIIVMGPSGCGKSTLAQALAQWTDQPFVEGDEHHPLRNIAMLKSGEPLTDEDRLPFLDSIGRALASAAVPTVVSCSALRRAHRDRLRMYAPGALFVWIDVPRDELERRVAEREGHFMPPSLVDNQLATLEPPRAPERFVRIDGSLPTMDQVHAVVLELAREEPGAQQSRAR